MNFRLIRSMNNTRVTRKCLLDLGILTALGRTYARVCPLCHIFSGTTRRHRLGLSGWYERVGECD
jgi:hypothetical protein